MQVDPEVDELLHNEANRQSQALHMLAPAMLTATWLRQLMASDASNLDGEGYVVLRDLPAARRAIAEGRYRSQKFNPCGQYMEFAEARAALETARAFHPTQPSALRVNLHPVSGTSANLAALMGVARPGAAVVALDPRSGGHISHGAGFHLTGRHFRFSHIFLGRNDRAFPLAAAEELLAREKPAAMIIGSSSFPWTIPWQEIADLRTAVSPKTVFIADIAHFAGLVLAGHYPNPVLAADIVTGVGYKSMGGPKSGFILTRRDDLHQTVARALFPGLQGAPRMADIIATGVAARLAVCSGFRTAMTEAIALRERIQNALASRSVLSAFGGSDTHMLVLDVGPRAGEVSGRLERAGILQNANMLPGDPSGKQPSGIRLGTIGLIQQGLAPADGAEIAELCASVIDDEISDEEARSQVIKLREKGRRRLYE
ncbi:hypothetical protein ACQPZJ_12940 [Actinoplanes sp. CA-054009]